MRPLIKKQKNYLKEKNMKIKDNFLAVSISGLHLRLYAEQNIESKKETEELICSLSDNISKVSENQQVTDCQALYQLQVHQLL